MAEVTIKSYRFQVEQKMMGSLEKAMEKVGALVERQAKINVSKSSGHPQVQTGRLRSSITHETAAMSTTIGTNVVYGKYLEFGTSRMPPYPWLFPAVEMKRNEIKDALKGKEFTVA